MLYEFECIVVAIVADVLCDFAFIQSNRMLDCKSIPYQLDSSHAVVPMFSSHIHTCPIPLIQMYTSAYASMTVLSSFRLVHRNKIKKSNIEIETFALFSGFDLN
jgi:hypothetical protein